MESRKISVVVPAKNEERSIGNVISRLIKVTEISEIIVVNDGSDDNTAKIAREAGAEVVSHPYSKGNGAAIKTGARAATGDILAFMDADGQHNPEEIKILLEKYDEGYDMVVGQRHSSAQENIGRLAANKIYNKLASWMVGHKIYDLTSGFRIVKASRFMEFISLLPNGFSYPATSTMAFFRVGYSVSYVPITVNKRGSESHINIIRDGIRFLLIIFKVGTLYSPLKLFFPVSSGFFLIGVLNYLYTFLTEGRFTNMSALLFILSILTLLMGLMSEQLTALYYKES